MTITTGAKLLVDCLEKQGVKYVFGIPGAKIDSVYNALLDSSIKIVVCRHEQNAAFIAQAYGRTTGKPGVVLVTSGPGVSNLATGLLTATTEGDPVIAIGANVPRNELLKAAHQSADNVSLLKATTKNSVQLSDVENIPEVIEDAFRIACEGRRGACFISVPQDILLASTELTAQVALSPLSYGKAVDTILDEAANLIAQAKLPVLLLGEEASRPQNTSAIRKLLANYPLATVSTFQAAGVISRELLELFLGRVGLFNNQPGDKILESADLILTVGFNCVEYDPEVWHGKQQARIIHLDYNRAAIHNTYRPCVEILGEISLNIDGLAQRLHAKKNLDPLVSQLHQELMLEINKSIQPKSNLIHPLNFIHALRQAVDDDTRVICDVGSVYMWFARHFLSYQPHHLLFSNGQQTLGVALPWAIGLHFAHPEQKIISISGDGGFLFSAMELETAVREKCKFIHFIWSDQRYNMVYEQELMKYQRGSGVDLGKLDIPSFAKGFGAHGFVLESMSDFAKIFKEANDLAGPVLIDVPIDYRDNPAMFKMLHAEVGG